MSCAPRPGDSNRNGSAGDQESRKRRVNFAIDLLMELGLREPLVEQSPALVVKESKLAAIEHRKHVQAES